jgi:hypothetical protein
MAELFTLEWLGGIDSFETALQELGFCSRDDRVAIAAYIRCKYGPDPRRPVVPRRVDDAVQKGAVKKFLDAIVAQAESQFVMHVADVSREAMAAMIRQFPTEIEGMTLPASAEQRICTETLRDELMRRYGLTAFDTKSTVALLLPKVARQIHR